MPHTISVTQMARRFAEYVNRVAHRGESFILVRGRKPIAEIRPLPSGRRLSELPELLDGLPHLIPGDADRFAADLERIRDEAAARADHDPWQS